ncbi:unnamed protein product [Urochloa humidicola]
MVEPIAAAGPAGGGVRKHRRRPRRRRTRDGDGGASKQAQPPAEAKPPVGVDASAMPSKSLEKEIEEGSVDDTEIEDIERVYGWPIEKQLPFYRRLYKKRANMALALYHRNHPDEQYQFAKVRLNEVYSFIEYRLKDPDHMHMNFVALNIKTGLEKLFFAELCMLNDVNDANSGFVAIACKIIDGNCAGGRRNKCIFKDGKFPPDYYDGENCYACGEKIRHPPGCYYRAGHDVLGYGVGVEESLVE